MNCPCCGQEAEGLSSLQAILHDPALSNMRRRFLQYLAERIGRWVEYDDLADWIWKDDPSGGPDDWHPSMRNMVHKIRRSGVLEKYGLVLATRIGRGNTGVSLRRKT